jgi:hypothetical protein
MFEYRIATNRIVHVVHDASTMENSRDVTQFHQFDQPTCYSAKEYGVQTKNGPARTSSFRL